MSSIDNSLEGGGSASASGKKGAVQLSDGNFNLTSNKELTSDPKTGTITTTGLTTTGTVFAATLSTSNLVADTITNLTVIGDATITGNAVVDGFVQGSTISSTGDVIVVGSLTAASSNVSGESKAATITSTENAYVTSNLGVGTTDTAEYKFLVKDGTSNLFGVPYNTTGLGDGKTIVYNGSGWVYDNAGPADGTQNGEILAWDGTEWSANSAVVVEGTNVGIGSTQPTQKLDVVGNVKATDFIGSGDGINDLNASNVTSGTLDNLRLPGTISVSNIEATANLVVGGPANITGTLSAADFIGSGDGINDLNASNVTSGTLDNLRLPGTISVSNIEATANLVVGGPADITGTLSAADFIGSGDGINDLNASNVTSGTLDNLRLPGTISVSNIEATANLVVGGPADITGTLSASSITTSDLLINGTLTTGNVETTNVIATHMVQGATISSTGQVIATGSLTGASATVTGQVQGATISSTGQVIATGSLTGASATVTGQVQGATVSSTGQVIATGSLTGASATVTGQVQGATVSSTGSIIATSTVTGSHVNTPTLVVSKDAQITGNLTVSGGLVTITSTTTGTNQINITNNGTGPALIAKQTGAQPIVNFLDDSASVFFISGGELTDKDGFVGLGTETPQERLDVQGNIVSSGTISSTNVSTSNLTVSNRLSGGTISVSNVEATANLVVGGPANITGTLSASNVETSNLTVSGPLIAASITSSDNVDISGTLSASILFSQTLSTSNVETSNLTITNLNTVTNDAFIGGTLSASNVETSNLTVSGPLIAASITSSDNVDISGTLSASILFSQTLSTSNVETSNLTVTNLNTVTNDALIGGIVRQGGGSTNTSTFLSGTSPGFTTDRFIYANAIVNSTQTGLSPAAIVFGNNSTYGGNEISLVTNGQNRLYMDNTGTVSAPGTVQGLNLTSTGTLSAAGITSSADINVPESGTGASITILPRTGNNTDNAIEIYQAGAPAVLTSRIQYNGDADFRTITVSNIQGGSPLTISASGGTINVQSNMIMVGSTLITERIEGNSPLTLSAGENDSINVASNMIMVGGSILTATTIQCATLTTESGVNSNLLASNIVASNLIQGSIVSATSSLTGVSMTVSGDVEGASASLGAIDGSSLTVSGAVQGLNLTSTGTLSAAGITSSAAVDVTGTITTSSNLVVGNSNLHVDNVTGNVGIGVASPTQLLDVRGGNIAISEGFSFVGLRTADDTVAGYITSNSGGWNIGETRGGNKTDIQVGVDDIIFSTGSTPDERMRILSTGNVGIGVASPGAKLHVDSTNPQIIIGSGTGGGEIEFGNSSHGVGRNTGQTNFTNANDVVLYTAGSGGAGLKTANGFLKVASNGNVGIGVASPVANVHMSGGNGPFRLYLEADEDNVTESETPKIVFIQDGGYYSGSVGMGNNKLELRNAAGGTNGISFHVGPSVAPDSETQLDDATKIMDITSGGVNVTGTISASGSIYVNANNGLEAVTGTYGSVQTFGTGLNGYDGYSINGDAVFMSNGTNYGLYDDTNNDWGIVCTKLGTTQLRYAGVTKLSTASGGVNVTGTISATGDITAFSDKRYKDDLLVIESALDKVKQLTGYTYTLHGNRSAGLLAQDVLEVLPEVVKGSEETNYSLAYGNLMGLVVEAIKELDKKVDRILEKHGSS